MKRLNEIKEGLLKELERVKDKDIKLLIIHVLDTIDQISGEEAKRNTTNFIKKREV